MWGRRGVRTRGWKTLCGDPIVIWGAFAHSLCIVLLCYWKQTPEKTGPLVKHMVCKLRKIFKVHGNGPGQVVQLVGATS